MWKKACLSLVLAALLPQAVTFAAYGDVIGTEPVPQVTAPATPKPAIPVGPKPTLPADPKPVTPAPVVTSKPIVKPKTPVPGQLAPEAAAKPEVTVKPKVVPEKKPAASDSFEKKSSEKKSGTRKATVYKAVYEQGDSGWKVREAQRRMRLLGYKLDNDQDHFTKDMSKQL